MLAGYLPFDDDPANPEGDNINLLYKYIVSTPLTFPEYVSPHARDLLRRILVPDPRKRADLFEVARHSWLSEYAHVVAHVTSSTTTIGDIANTTVNEGKLLCQPELEFISNISLDLSEAPLLNRSASVREPTKPYSSNIPAVGGLSHQGKLDTEAEKASRDPKRRTVQVEYVEPKSQTVRGEASPPQVPATALTESDARIKATSESSRKVHAAVATRKPLPQDPPNIATHSGRTPQRINVVQAGMPPPSRPGREPPRSVSDSTGAFAIPPAVIARPNTGGSMSSANGGRLPSRGNSYSQPLAPTVAVTTAQGRLAQPKGARPYNISAPVPQPEPYISDSPQGRPVSQRLPIKTNTGSTDSKGHKRSTTLSNVFGRSGSLFGIKSPASPSEGNKLEKKYPPTSMKSPLASSDSPRQSTDSRRPSIGFGRKNSDLSKQEKPRRFSLLPASFSFKNFTGSKDSDSAKYPDQKLSNTSNTPGQGSSRQSFDSQRYDGVKDPYPQQNRQVSAPVSRQYDRPPKSAPQSSHERYASTQYPSSNSRPLPPGHSYFIGESGPPTDLEASLSRPQQQKPRYPPGFNDDDEQPRLSMQQQRGTRVLQKPNRKFADAWDQDNDRGHHAGTSGAAKRVMDFFRRRGKARSGDER